MLNMDQCTKSTVDSVASDTISGDYSFDESWGKITPCDSTTTKFDLKYDFFAIGSAATCQWKIPQASTDVPSISPIQCTIEKNLSDVHNPVFIEDRSSVGTYLNGELIGRGRKRILKSGDEIAFLGNVNNFFVFHKKNEEDSVSEIYNQFHIGKELGKGGFGRVREVTDRKTLVSFAMKAVKVGEQKIGFMSKIEIENEIEICTVVAHENILRLHQVVQTGNKVFMFFEVMSGGSLLNRIKDKGCLTVDKSKFYFRQMCSAVKYLHGQNIVHCDIKPDNILLTDTTEHSILKLADFGLSQRLKENSLSKKLPASLYAAPEIHNLSRYDKKIDVWSLGVVLYTMLFGMLPFCTPTLIKSGRLNERPLMDVSEAVNDLILTMLKINSEERPGIDELDHKWLTEYEISGSETTRERQQIKRYFEGDNSTRKIRYHTI